MRQDIKTVDGKIEKVDHKVDILEQGAKEALTGLSERLDDVEEDLKLLRKELKDVQSQVTSFQQEANAKFDNLRGQFAELQSSLSNTTAIQLNALRKWLDDPLEPVSALIPVQGKLVSAIAPDFPQTVRGFWQLTSNISALLRLAKHYSVTGWERWQRSTSDETDRTEFADLDIAVAAHARRCMMALTSKWGLQYAFLERPRKRSAETDDESEVRRVRLWRLSRTDIVESVISQDESGELTCQDQVTRFGPPQPVPSDSVIMNVYEHYAGAPGALRISFESAELGWHASMASKTLPGSGKSRRS
ncbi:hypothetical protein BJX70DRAFT_404413 [Aspergillus crustosus]